MTLGGKLLKIFMPAQNEMMFIPVLILCIDECLIKLLIFYDDVH